MHAAAAEIRAELREEFPGWRILTSDRDRWWALRGPMPPDRINETDAIDADTADELRRRLREVEMAVPLGSSDGL